MKRTLTILSIALLCLACSEKKKQTNSNPERIISLAPSITEVICAIGEGDKLVAVTSYCDFPEEVTKLPKIGGLFDTSIEAIYATNPDLVIHVPSQMKTAASLNNIGIETFCVSQKNIVEINSSITKIAERLACPEKAQQLLKEIAITPVKSPKSNPKVLIVISRDLTSKAIDDAYLVGKNTWYNDLLINCGAQNSFGGKIPYPSFSIEGAMIMNPDIIIELVTESTKRGFSLDKLKAIWKNSLPEIKAVKNDRIYIIEETYAVRPGPRYALLYERFKEIINK